MNVADWAFEKEMIENAAMIVVPQIDFIYLFKNVVVILKINKTKTYKSMENGNLTFEVRTK